MIAIDVFDICIRDAGIAVIGIGVGIQDVKEVTAIASKPSSNFLHLLDDYYYLPDIIPKLVKFLCSGESSILLKKCMHYFGNTVFIGYLFVSKYILVELII